MRFQHEAYFANNSLYYGVNEEGEVMKNFFLRLGVTMIISVFTSPLAAQSKIDLTEGTLFLDGQMSFTYGLISFTKPQHSFSLTTNIGGGYFIFDNIAVGISVPGKWKIAPTSGGELGLKIFSDYYFDIDSGIFPYAGASVTPGYDMSEKLFQLSVGLEGGVLVSLSESVAVDFGIRPEIYFQLFDTQKWKFIFPAGFLGIKAVF